MDGIMVSAATGVMNSLLDKLTTLLGEEYKLQKGMKRDITFLKDELSSMNALLQKLAEKEELDPQMNEWRNQVREMAYDIEDCIDDYMCRLHHEPNKVGGIKGFILESISRLKNLGAHHGISDQIEELKVRITETNKRRKRYKVDEVVSAGSANVVPIDPRVHVLYEEATNLVGIDGPRDKLIKLMVDDREMQLKVVSIVGLGGLGKTTLANQVYQNLSGHFEHRAFVSMSRIPDMTKILQTILFQIKKQECDDIKSWDEARLINELRQFLEDKRYFVVIDDIWDARAWRNIKCALPDSNCSSRIMTTTRIISVAQSCCLHSHDHVHEISPLSKADSEGLFFKRIFKSEDGCPPHLKDVSIEIVRRCCGLPLAIITMASLLSNRSYRREEWMTVWDSIGLGLDKHCSVEDMNKILSLSYVDLPCYLRTCLLYLGIFPEDYVIKRDRLIKRWIAEGFIKAAGGITLEEEGECYFNELINRSMIQPVGIKYNGQVKACRVHDMILELIIMKAKEENFVTLINQKDVRLPQCTFRRLSLQYCDQECTTVSSLDRFLEEKSSMGSSQTRSLSIYGYSQQIPLLSNFRALRVLDIEGLLTRDYLMNIGELLQLRYLRLSTRSITELPENIGQLQLLETLDVKETDIRELPARIVQLQKLKHLLVRDVKLPAGIGNMRSLEKLSQLRVDDSCSFTSLLELGSLTNLRFLGLFWRISNSHNDKRIYTDNLVLSLCKIGKSNLRFLRVRSELYGCKYDGGSCEFTFDSWSPPPEWLQELTLYPNCYVCKIPRWMVSLANLAYLEIEINPVEQEALDIFGKLSALQFLELSSKRIVPRGLTISRGMFQCLKVFHLYCHDIETGLMFESGAMLNIERLELPFRACRAQSTCGAYDISIHHLSTLQHLNVRISCKGADAAGVAALEAAIRDAASLLPNHPVPCFRRYYEYMMVYDDREDQSTEQAPPNAYTRGHYQYCCVPRFQYYDQYGPFNMEFHGEDPGACTIC